MAESNTSERMITAAERQVQALALRKAGVSYEQIASALGYASGSGAYQAVHRALRKMLKEPAEEVRDLEVARLDEMLRALWPGVQAGEPKKVLAALRVMERRAKLLGLDAPAKIDVRHMIEELAREFDMTPEQAAAAVAEAERIVKAHE